MLEKRFLCFTGTFHTRKYTKEIARIVCYEDRYVKMLSKNRLTFSKISILACNQCTTVVIL